MDIVAGSWFCSHSYLVKCTPVVDLKAQEEKSNHDMLERKKIEEAIEWYSRFLGFRVECGEGKI